MLYSFGMYLLQITTPEKAQHRKRTVYEKTILIVKYFFTLQKVFLKSAVKPMLKYGII